MPQFDTSPKNSRNTCALTFSPVQPKTAWECDGKGTREGKEGLARGDPRIDGFLPARAPLHARSGPEMGRQARSRITAAQYRAKPLSASIRCAGKQNPSAAY